MPNLVLDYRFVSALGKGRANISVCFIPVGFEEDKPLVLNGFASDITPINECICPVFFGIAQQKFIDSSSHLSATKCTFTFILWIFVLSFDDIV